MKGEALLLTLAQVGLAFAGISSILTIFQKKGLNWTLREVIGMKFMLEHSIGLLVCSVLPLSFYYIFDAINQLIRTDNFELTKFDSERASIILASFILCFFNIFQFISFFKRKRKITSIGEKAAAEKAMLFIFLPITLIVALILALNSIFGFGLIGLYVAGLTWQLLNGVIQFFVFILVLTNEEVIKIETQKSQENSLKLNEPNSMSKDLINE